MTDFINLLGADDVRAAGSKIQGAASDMNRAAGSIEDSLHRHRLFLDDFLARLECMLKELSE